MEAQPKEKNRDYITDSNLYILIIPKLLGWHLSLAIPNQILQYPPLHIFDHWLDSVCFSEIYVVFNVNLHVLSITNIQIYHIYTNIL